MLKLFTNSVPIQLQFNAAEIMAQIPSMSLTKIKEKSLLIVTILQNPLVRCILAFISSLIKRLNYPPRLHIGLIGVFVNSQKEAGFFPPHIECHPC